MTNEILIDAVHQEETRIAIIKNKRLEDYDYEFDAKKPIRGNIYLAKVIRVEPVSYTHLTLPTSKIV